MPDHTVCPLNPDASRELGRLEGKVDALTLTITQSREERLQWQRDFDAKLFAADGVVVRHSTRLGELERWRARSGGVVKALSVLWGLVAVAIGWLISLWPWR